MIDILQGYCSNQQAYCPDREKAESYKMVGLHLQTCLPDTLDLEQWADECVLTATALMQAQALPGLWQALFECASIYEELRTLVVVEEQLLCH